MSLVFMGEKKGIAHYIDPMPKNKRAEKRDCLLFICH